MHVCFLCSEYPPHAHGGIGVFTQTLGEALVRRGHRVTVIGTYLGAHTDSDDVVAGVRVIRLAHRGPARVGALRDGWELRRRLRQLHAADPIDLLEGSEMSLVFAPALAGAVRVVRLHGGHAFYARLTGTRMRASRRWLEARSLRKADRVLAVSRFVAQETAAAHAMNFRGVDVVYNGVDTERFAPGPEPCLSPGRIIFVGTLCEKKGVRQLVAAMPHVLAQVPGASLELIGRDTTDPESGASYIASVLASADTTTTGVVHVHGQVSHADLPSLMRGSAVAVYPSHAEAMGIACAEGLAMRLPCVVSARGPGPELIEEEASGLLCDPSDPVSIATAIVRLLTDAALRERCARGARERAERLFSLASQTDRNEAIYRDALVGRRR